MNAENRKALAVSAAALRIKLVSLTPKNFAMAADYTNPKDGNIGKHSKFINQNNLLVSSKYHDNVLGAEPLASENEVFNTRLESENMLTL